VDSDEETEHDIVMTVGDSADPTSLRRRTMKLNGKVGQLDVLILVDSGSVATFISDKLARQLDIPVSQRPAAKFLTADGSTMVCDSAIAKLQWSVQGHTFISEAGILPLKCYDMILGADWLEECSPMWVHWKKKLMKFSHQGKRITLSGVKPVTSKCTSISAGKLKGLVRRNAVSCCLQLKLQKVQHEPVSSEEFVGAVSTADNASLPPEIQQVVAKYSHLFQEPVSLPPERQCDHSIPLIPGAQPVNVRSYRYAPAQKTD